MSKKSRGRNALAVGVSLVVAAALSTAGVALATAPKTGWTYTTQPTAKVFVTFKVVLKLYPLGRAGQKSSGTDTVTAKFVKGGKATGTVSTHFDFQGPNSFCRGVKQNYTAIGMA